MFSLPRAVGPAPLHLIVIGLAAGIAALLGAIVLVGWAMDVPALRSVIRGAVEMKANTAVGLITSAGALWFSVAPRMTAQAARVAPALAWCVVLLGLCTLAEYAFSWDLAIDELLVRDGGAAFNQAKGRMSPYTAAAFAALGFAVALLRHAAAAAPVRALAGAVTAIGVVSLLGYFWNASEIVSDRLVPPVAVNTAVAFVLLGSATWFASLRPELEGPRARSRIEAMVLTGFVPAMLVLVVGGGYTYQSGVKYAESTQSIVHSQRVRAQLGELYAAISDAETAQRDYILTDRPKFTAEFHHDVNRARASVEALAPLLQDNPSQLARFVQLREMSEARIESLQSLIDTFDVYGEAATRAGIAAEAEPALMRQVRTLSADMQGTETRLLDSRSAAAETDRRATLVSLLTTLLLATGLFAVLFRSIRREVVARNTAEEQIRQLNDSLERRVNDRTAELSKLTTELEHRVDARTHELKVSNLQLERARQDAEQASRAKSAFLAAMSHEIRTPMNGVVGMIDVLAQSRLDPDQREAVQTIRGSSFTLLGLIDGILDFSKIEAGRMELERLPVPLGELVESVCRSLASVASEKGVGVRVFIDPALPARAWADPTRLRQIVTNLLGNAIKFSAGHSASLGRVSVRALASDDGKSWTMAVADNGVGMAPATLDRLFNSFSQAETSTTRRFGGTGLGLAISHRLAALMGGSIDVTSELSVGSTFTVRLPIEPIEGDRPVEVPDLAGVNCVIVEGPEIDAGAFAAYLSAAGAIVRCAPDPTSAIAAARTLANGVVLAHQDRSAGAPALPPAFDAAPEVRKVLLTIRPEAFTSRPGRNVVAAFGNALGRLSLLRAVATAAGRACPVVELADQMPGPQRFTPAPTVEIARANGTLILVAEDDAVNRKVIQQQLALLGHAAEIFPDGAQALAAWRRGSHALLLTDLHMPAMGGYALASTIRAEERGRRMPILALSANALQGEAVRARAAGIDEYLTKPMQLRLLGDALEMWLAAAPELVGPAPANGRAAPVFDPAVLPLFVGHDSESLRDCLEQYLISAQVLATEIRSTFASRELQQLGASAHKLKSSSRAVGALALAVACERLEEAALDENRTVLAGCAAAFEDAVRTLEPHLRAHLTEEHVGN